MFIQIQCFIFFKNFSDYKNFKIKIIYRSISYALIPIQWEKKRKEINNTCFSYVYFAIFADLQHFLLFNCPSKYRDCLDY